MSRIIGFLVLFLAIGAVSVNAQCSTCEALVGIIEQFVENNASISEIEQYLEQLCSLVPAFQTVCDQLVTTGIPQIVHWLQQNESPQQVCTQLGLCSSASENFHHKVNQRVKQILKFKGSKVNKIGDAVCDGCQQVIGIMETWVASQSTEAQIENYLEALCQLVPAFQQTCDAIAQAGVPAVVNWIVQNENATVVCSQLGLCSTKSKFVAQKPLLPTPLAAPQDTCNLCEIAIKAIEGWLENNATEDEIETYLEDALCVLIPGMQQVCDAIIAKGIPTIVQWIENNESPTVVCQQIGLCSSQSRSPRKKMTRLAMPIKTFSKVAIQ